MDDQQFLRAVENLQDRLDGLHRQYDLLKQEAEGMNCELIILEGDQIWAVSRPLLEQDYQNLLGTQFLPGVSVDGNCVQTSEKPHLARNDIENIEQLWKQRKA